MLAGKAERRRQALRASIQMGGASFDYQLALEEFIATVACVLSDEDTCKCISLMFKVHWPRAADSGALPEADVERILDGYYWKDGR